MDPRNPHDVKIGMTVKASLSKNDPPEKWIITKVKNKLISDDVEICPDGVEIIFSDNRSGFVKGFPEKFIELTEDEIKNLIQNHENFVFELKASFQFSTKKQRQAECLKENISREIVAMMNTKGGRVCIGVDNSKNILGLQNDYKFLKNIKKGQPKKDSFIQELRDFVNSRLGNKTVESLYNAYVSVIEDKEICIVDVKESLNTPVFVLEKFKMKQCDSEDTDPLQNGKRWVFYIKTDRGTSEKSPYEASSFWKEHKETKFI